MINESHGSPAAAEREPARVFVFGSNLRGVHGLSAALWAVQHRGAQMGVAEGPQGQSYAIPTKDQHLRPLPLARIATGVERFLAHASDHPETRYEVTAIGTGLAGYSVDQVAPLFASAPANCHLPERFLPYVPERGQRHWRVELRRGAGHPVTGQDGWDQLVVYASTETLLDTLIEKTTGVFWRLWRRDRRGQCQATLYKPSGATAAWVDN
jgi:hypothetical protein